MTRKQKFLLLFADYREALDRVTKAEDEARFERGRADSLAEQLATAQKDSLERERVWADRMAVNRYGPRAVLTNEQIAQAALTQEPRKQANPATDVREWQRNQTMNALKTFDEFAQKVSNG